MVNYRRFRDLAEEAAKLMLSPPAGIRLPWYRTMTEYLGGLRPNELTLLCAPTGAGKTTLLGCLSAQLLQEGVSHFVAPVETGDVDFATRVLSALSDRDLNTGTELPLHVVERAMNENMKHIKSDLLTVSTHDNRVSVEQMIMELEFQTQKHGIKVALLDNLNFFLNVTSSQMEKAEMDNAIHEFIMLTKKIPIHIILVVHPRKTENGRVESEFDIKGSSVAVQEASNVLLMNRPSKEHVKEGKTIYDREFVFKKIRKRGFNVGRPFWMTYSNGTLVEFEER